MVAFTGAIKVILLVQQVSCTISTASLWKRVSSVPEVDTLSQTGSRVTFHRTPRQLWCLIIAARRQLVPLYLLVCCALLWQTTHFWKNVLEGLHFLKNVVHLSVPPAHLDPSNLGNTALTAVCMFSVWHTQSVWPHHPGQLRVYVSQFQSLSIIWRISHVLTYARLYKVDKRFSDHFKVTQAHTYMVESFL